MKRFTFVGLVGAVFFPSIVVAVPTPFEAAGGGDVAIRVAEFQTALGDPNNGNAPGPIAAGRRQINWDAGIVPFEMPRDFFNNPVFPPTRGATFSTATNEFRVSNDGVDNEFDTFNADNPNQFTTFSAPRLFASLDSTMLDVNFFVPASNVAATVSGFGAIFTDVDTAGSAMLEFFDESNASLLVLTAPTDPQGLSFIGATFSTERVARVKITAGTDPIGAGLTDGGAVDVVVIDDLLYGEPQAQAIGVVPEPVSAILGLMSIGALGMVTKRRRGPFEA